MRWSGSWPYHTPLLGRGQGRPFSCADVPTGRAAAENTYVILGYGASYWIPKSIRELHRSMPTQVILAVDEVYPLPPLILHPFTETASTVRVLESAKASLSLLREGAADSDQAELERQLLDGRYAEVRMLFYVGKDIFRWMEQCLDACAREPGLSGHALRHQSFAQLLIKHTPDDVEEKLKSWGVVEYVRIFSRSIGIYSQFSEPPSRESLQNNYLRHYYRYADCAFVAWRDLCKSPKLPAENFPFILYASGEYTRMLEQQWEETL